MLPIFSYDLLPQFNVSLTNLFSIQPHLQLNYQQSRTPQYQMSQFDNRAAQILRVIKSILTTIDQTWQSWKNNTSEFKLENKLMYVKHVGSKINHFNIEIRELTKKVKEQHFACESQDGETYQFNVCRCLDRYLFQASNFFKQLEQHVDQKKRYNDKVLNQPARQSKQEEVAPKYEPGFKDQAEKLQKQMHKSKESNMQRIQQLLAQIHSIVEETRIEAFKQDDMLIKFEDHVRDTNVNVEGGNQNLKGALKYEGEAREFWMWLFITMTIMIVVLDFVKK